MAEANKTPNSGVTDTNELQSTRAGSGMADASDQRQSTRIHEPEAVKDLKATVGAIAGTVEQTWDDAKQYVRENPTKAVFIALGIGLVLGLIFRR